MRIPFLVLSLALVSYAETLPPPPTAPPTAATLVDYKGVEEGQVQCDAYREILYVDQASGNSFCVDFGYVYPDVKDGDLGLPAVSME